MCQTSRVETAIRNLKLGVRQDTYYVGRRRDDEEMTEKDSDGVVSEARYAER